MTTTELRGFALDELRRRLRIPREYKLRDVTVWAAVKGNFLDLSALRRAGDNGREGVEFPWFWEGSHAFLKPAQARAIVTSVDETEAAEYVRLGLVCQRIDAGEITTETQVVEAFGDAQ